MRTSSIVLTAAFAAFVPLAAHAQAINVDFGDGLTAPSASYAAAGRAGVWNAIGVMPAGVRFDLVGLDGQPITAKLYGIGGTQMLVSDIAATSGDDEALLDDMFIGYNNPVDVCLWFEYLEDGEYEITTYALTPDNAALLSPVRVDFGTPGPTPVGGTWAGAHAEGLTYARHVVTTVNGKIGLHSGTYGAGGQAGINGLQIRPMFPVGVGSFVPDVTRCLAAIPNPARRSTTQQIMFEVAAGQRLRAIEIVDVTGRIVWQRTLDGSGAPSREFGVTSWDGTDRSGRAVPSGLYFARLVSDGDAPSEGFRVVRLE